MIPLGSCTMKLNATAEMMPVTFPGFANVHPFAPDADSEGYEEIVDTLEEWLAEITGFDAVSLQPNSGAMGEYTGLLTIRAYHQSRGDSQRTVCLIPTSAHGTNPASAVMAGMDVVAVKVTDAGEVDLDDLRAKAEKHADRLAALMITYPSTHGVFEHDDPGDGRRRAPVGRAWSTWTAPTSTRWSVCAGRATSGWTCATSTCTRRSPSPTAAAAPGMGPIGVVETLAPFLPGHPVVPTGGDEAIGPVAAAPCGQRARAA